MAKALSRISLVPIFLVMAIVVLPRARAIFRGFAPIPRALARQIACIGCFQPRRYLDTLIRDEKILAT
jgi:hypothetical protein